MPDFINNYEDTLVRSARLRKARRKKLIGGALQFIGLVVLTWAIVLTIVFALNLDDAFGQESGPVEATQCIAAIIGAGQDRVVTPDEAQAVLAACDQGALEALGQRPVGCDRDRPNAVTCGYPRRSMRRHPGEFARYNRVRMRLIRCRYQQLADVRLPQCIRLYRQFRARWVEGQGVRDPDLPEQVRFTLQRYDWVR